MTAGINARDRVLEDVLQGILDRIARLERPAAIHLGGIGGAIGGFGFTLAVNAAGNLVAISDSGTTTVIALQ